MCCRGLFAFFAAENVVKRFLWQLRVAHALHASFALLLVFKVLHFAFVVPCGGFM